MGREEEKEISGRGEGKERESERRKTGKVVKDLIIFNTSMAATNNKCHRNRDCHVACGTLLPHDST